MTGARYYRIWRSTFALLTGLAAACSSGNEAPMPTLVDARVDIANPRDTVMAVQDSATIRDTRDTKGNDAAGSDTAGAKDTLEHIDADTAEPVEDVVAPPLDSDKDGVIDPLDCAPNNAKVHPGATETCNSVDDDCDGKTDEGVTNKCGKCGAVPNEVCNGKDDDCDGSVDEGVKNKCGKCGAVPNEVCNGKDDDCDGAKDEGGVCDSAAPKVCYPGSANNYSVCLKLTAKATIKVAGYNWPANSNSQYKSPVNLLDLGSASSGLVVAKNFKLGEFMQASKGKYGVYSAMTVARWQSVRSALGVPLTVNSGFRSPGYNAGVSGSAKFSRHTYGDAADVTAKGKVSLSKIASTCKANGAGYTQLYATHVHCDWRNDPLGHDFWPKKNAFGAWRFPPDAKSEAPGGSNDWQEQAAWAKVVGPDVTRPMVGRRMVLRAAWGPGFDEGIPWVQWHVHGPKNSWSAGPQTGLAFTPQVAGNWRIDWQVGGNVSGTITFEVAARETAR